MQGSNVLGVHAVFEGNSVNGAGFPLSLHRIHDQDPFGLLNFRERIQKSGPGFQHDNILRQLLLPEGAGRMNAHALVAEEEVADAENQCPHGYCLDPAFTTVTAFPFGRITCTAQERHGSKEWITRNTSIGWVGSATGVPIKACSIGP